MSKKTTDVPSLPPTTKEDEYKKYFRWSATIFGFLGATYLVFAHPVASLGFVASVTIILVANWRRIRKTLEDRQILAIKVRP